MAITRACHTRCIECEGKASGCLNTLVMWLAARMPRLTCSDGTPWCSGTT